MAGFNFNPITVQPQAQTSLGDMLNVARNAQAYQQAQQLNPLQLQQAQLANQISQQNYQQAQQLNPLIIEKAEAEASKSGIEAKQSKRNYLVSGEDYARRMINALPEIKDFVDKTGEVNQNALKKSLDIVRKSSEAVGLEKHPSNFLGQLEDAVAKKDYDAYQQIKASALGSSGKESEQYQANLPSFAENKLGQPILQNKATGEIKTPKTANVMLPTAVGVQNFGDYQKGLTDRVSSGIQIDSRINEAENLMKQFKPGAGARTYQSLAQKLQAVGAPQELVDKVAGGDLSATQSFNKFIAQSITSGIGQLADKQTAAMMNNYLENNPDVSTDPRALQRFFDFAHRQNQMSYDEQQFLLDKTKSKSLNPDTHPAEAQQMILDKYVRSKEQPKEQPQEKPQSKSQVAPKSHGKVVKTGSYNGKPVVQYEDGTVEYK